MSRSACGLPAPVRRSTNRGAARGTSGPQRIRLDSVAGWERRARQLERRRPDAASRAQGGIRRGSAHDRRSYRARRLRSPSAAASEGRGGSTPSTQRSSASPRVRRFRRGAGIVSRCSSTGRTTCRRSRRRSPGPDRTFICSAGASRPSSISPARRTRSSSGTFFRTSRDGWTSGSSCGRARRCPCSGRRSATCSRT